MKKFYLGLALLALAGTASAKTIVSYAWDPSKVLVPSSEWTPDQPYEALVWVHNTGEKFSGGEGGPNYNKIWATPENDANGNEWYKNAYSPVGAWETKTAPFSSDAEYKGHASYQWVTNEIMGEIYMRRTFTLNSEPEGPIHLACGHDDSPSEWYINGTLVYSSANGWNNPDHHELTDEQKALIKFDGSENLLAVHVHQNWGGAFADCGLYASAKSEVEVPGGVESPFTGSVAPAEGKADFYLYQVESGKWLQNNTWVTNQWTTRAQLYKNGMDIEVSNVTGGYQLNPKLGANHSINGGNLYMDTGDPLTTWTLTQISDGDVNAYTISAGKFLGETDGQLEMDAANVTWQLISREERIAKMVANVANGPQNATWLIPGNDFGRNDERGKLWNHSCINANSGGDGHDGQWRNAVREAWHMITDYDHSIKLTGLPSGTYKFRVQGFYRDEDIHNLELGDRAAAGTMEKLAWYYANEKQLPFMTIAEGAASAEWGDHYTYEIKRNPAEGEDEAQGTGLWVPDSMQNASAIFSDDENAYQNEWIEVYVTDGNLKLGVAKAEGRYHDWLIFDNFQLLYVSTQTGTVDLTAQQEELTALIAQAKKLFPATTALNAVIADAEAALASANSIAALLEAIDALKAVVSEVKKAANDIKAYNDTKAYVKGADTSACDAKFDAATKAADFAAALRDLRYIRRRAAADRHADVFQGAEPAVGRYYLYNVGQRQFLCGGSDWGAHAALGFPGLEISLELNAGSTDDLVCFDFETGLYNGDSSHYMNYRGYMDCGKAGGWEFVPVEGQEGVYAIRQADYTDVYVMWNPNASVDGHQADETTVGTENRGYTEVPTNPDAWWKLVTAAERDALLEAATLDKPADASYMIGCPNFNQREDVSIWMNNGFNYWGRGTNYPDFAAESWNSTTADLNQQVQGLPNGVYALSVSGFYRAAAHDNDTCDGEETLGQPDTEFLQNAFLYGPGGEEPLPNINACDNMVPGDMREAKSDLTDAVYHWPYDIPAACRAFRNGLYKTTLVFEKFEGEDPVIGVYKDIKGGPGDWVVIDNFRLTFFGAETTVDAVESKLQDGVEEIAPEVVVPVDNRIFNLQGIQVKDMSAPGIYIVNGKKYMVK